MTLILGRNCHCQVQVFADFLPTAVTWGLSGSCFVCACLESCTELNGAVDRKIDYESSLSTPSCGGLPCTACIACTWSIHLLLRNRPVKRRHFVIDSAGSRVGGKGRGGGNQSTVNTCITMLKSCRLLAWLTQSKSDWGKRRDQKLLLTINPSRAVREFK